jgi:hypothetical protein
MEVDRIAYEVEVEVGGGAGAFGGERAASATMLCGRTREDDDQEAGELDARGFLLQHEQPEKNTARGFKRHERTERIRRHLAQRKELEREWQDGEQDGQSGPSRDDAEGEVARGLGYAGDGSGRCTDGDGN